MNPCVGEDSVYKHLQGIPASTRSGWSHRLFQLTDAAQAKPYGGIAGLAWAAGSIVVTPIFLDSVQQSSSGIIHPMRLSPFSVD